VHYDDLQIEHIMPQSWETHWPITDHQGAVVPKDENNPTWVFLSANRRRIVDRIGNLTLVTSTFNRDVSNLGWNIKKSEFEKQKSLVINYAVAKSEVWDEARIADRAHVLAAAAVRLWPSAESLLLVDG
jgi:hypothetical protein